MIRLIHDAWDAEPEGGGVRLGAWRPAGRLGPRDDGGASRRAGVIQLDPSRPPPTTLPTASDFSRASAGLHGGPAYWIARDRSAGEGDYGSPMTAQYALFRGNGSEILRDVRDAVNMLTADSMVGTRFLFSLALLAGVRRVLEAREPPVTAPPPMGPADGGRVSLPWLRAVLCAAYGEFSVRVDISEFYFPSQVILPELGGDVWPEAVGEVAVNHGFMPSALGSNPVVGMPGHVVEFPEDTFPDPGHPDDLEPHGDVTPPGGGGGGSGIAGVITALIVGAVALGGTE